MQNTQKRVQLIKIGCKFITYLSHNEEVLAFFIQRNKKNTKKQNCCIKRNATELMRSIALLNIHYTVFTQPEPPPCG